MWSPTFNPVSSPLAWLPSQSWSTIASVPRAERLMLTIRDVWLTTGLSTACGTSLRRAKRGSKGDGVDNVRSGGRGRRVKREAICSARRSMIFRWTLYAIFEARLSSLAPCTSFASLLATGSPGIHHAVESLEGRESLDERVRGLGALGRVEGMYSRQQRVPI